VEELEWSYLSDVELVSASQNAEDSLKVSGQNERPFLQPISAYELKDLMDSRFAKKTVDQAMWVITVFDFDDCMPSIAMQFSSCVLKVVLLTRTAIWLNRPNIILAAA